MFFVLSSFFKRAINELCASRKVEMALGGLGLKLATLRLQKPTRKCQRCGLRYPKEAEKCTHCGELGERELNQLRQTIDEHRQSNRRLGLIFVVAAVLLLFGLLLITQ